MNEKLKKIFIPILALLSSFGIVGMTMGFFTVHAGPFCHGLGTAGLIKKAPATITKSDATSLGNVENRKYTVLELFRGGSDYSIPFGENDGDWFRAENKTISEGVKELTEDQKKRLEEQGKSGYCLFNEPTIWFQSISENVIGLIADFINWITSFYFDSHFICDPDKTDKGDLKGCLDLLGTIGGKSQGDAKGGLIGRLSRGIYFPLLAIAFTTVGVWLLYKGIIKREFRSSLQGIIWSFFALFLGIATAVKPWWVARAPFYANQIITGCVINVLSGGTCDGDPEALKNEKTDQSCVAYADGKVLPEQASQLALSGAACGIVKGFTLDRWALQQFGYDWNDLYTKNPPEGANLYPADKLQGSPDDYCVNLKSSTSANQMKNNPNTNSVPVCHIALAYMADSTTGNWFTSGPQKGVSKRLLVVATAAKDEKMWSAMIGNNRDYFAIGGIIAALAAGFSFIPVSLMGMAYNLTATVLMALAPIFCLFAIHPGRGRKIFLGWLETVVSTILKFFAIGMLILIMLTIYQAVFANIRGGVMIMVVTIILAFTFSMYRKEITNLIGATNMGGVKVANKMGQAMDKMKDSAIDKAKTGRDVLIGGAAGGIIEQLKNNKERKKMAGEEDKKKEPLPKGVWAKTKEITKRGAKAVASPIGTVAVGGARGMAHAAMINAKRGNGFIANAARTGSQLNNKHQKAVDDMKRQEIESVRHQDMIDSVGALSEKMAEQLQNQKLAFDQTRLIDKIDDKAENVSSEPIKDVLETLKSDVINAKPETIHKVEGEVQAKLEIAKDIDKDLTNYSNKQHIGIEKWAKDEERKGQVDIENKVEEIKETMTKANHSPEEIEKVIQNYRNNANEKLTKNIDNLKSQFKLQTVKNDKGHVLRSKVESVDLNAIKDIKDDIKESINGIDVNRLIEESLNRKDEKEE